MKKKAIIYIVFFLCNMCFGSFGYGQMKFDTSQVTMSLHGYSYTIHGDTIHICEAILENRSSEEYVIWFDSANVKRYNDREKIQSYFYKFKGDFSLYNLMTEGIIHSQPVMLFGNFLKKLRSKEKFSIRIIGGKTIEKHFPELVKNHMVFLSKNILIKQLKLKEDYFKWYNESSIELKEEFFRYR